MGSAAGAASGGELDGAGAPAPAAAAAAGGASASAGPMLGGGLAAAQAALLAERAALMSELGMDGSALAEQKTIVSGAKAARSRGALAKAAQAAPLPRRVSSRLHNVVVDYSGDGERAAAASALPTAWDLAVAAKAARRVADGDVLALEFVADGYDRESAAKILACIGGGDAAEAAAAETAAEASAAP